jgi:hypothetical protein
MLELAHEHEQNLVSQAKRLGDEQLIERLKRLVAQDRAMTARLLVHFGEVDARGLYRDHAYHSMFEYAVHALHMSESEAGLRIRVSRLGRQFPVALEMLARGELHLTALKLLAPVLTQDNVWLLEAARFKSKQQVLELLAQQFPKPDVPSAIRRLPGFSVSAATSQPVLPEISRLSVSAPRPQSMPVADTGESNRPALPTSAWPATPASAARAAARSASSLGLAPPRATSGEIPLSPGRYKVQFTADQRLHDKLKQAQELLRHQVPSGDMAVVFERALDLLIAERKKQLFAQTDKPRIPPADRSHKPDSRHVPHGVRRQVLARDGEQCSFVSANGGRCLARGMLEFHHRAPYARGGAATADNIQLLCREHNALMAERDYGRTFMRERIAQQRAAPAPSRSVDQHVAEPADVALQIGAAARPARAVEQHVPELAERAPGTEAQRAAARPARAVEQHVPELAERAPRTEAQRAADMPAHATGQHVRPCLRAPDQYVQRAEIALHGEQP